MDDAVTADLARNLPSNMTEDEFWANVAATRAAQSPTPGEWLSALLQHDSAQLVAFDHWWTRKLYQAYDWRLWDAAYVLQGGCSDDGFFEFRNALIGMGREAYEAITANPDVIVDWFDDEDDYWDKTEAMAELAYDVQDAWRKAAGQSEDAYIEHADLPHPTQPTGQARADANSDTEEAGLRASVPRAMAAYWDSDGGKGEEGKGD